MSKVTIFPKIGNKTRRQIFVAYIVAVDRHRILSTLHQMEYDDSQPQAADVKRMKGDKSDIWQKTTVLCWGAHDLGQLGLGRVARDTIEEV